MTTVLAEKRAVITGGTRGVGYAIAQAYVREGAAVAVASRNTDAVSRAVESLKVEGGKALGATCDVGDREQILNLAQRVIRQWGGFEIWINNAGLSPAYGPTWEIPMDQLRRTIETNILGVAYGSWLAMQHFQARGHGLLINLLGRGSRRPSPYQNSYGASKTWVRSFTRTLAEEVKNPDIRVVAFNPGLIYSDLTEEVESVPGPRDRLQMFSKVLGLLGNPPERAAEVAVWLASERGRKAGHEHSLVSPLSLIGRALFEGVAVLLGRRQLSHPVSIEVIEPASSPLSPGSEADGQ